MNNKDKILKIFVNPSRAVSVFLVPIFLVVAWIILAKNHGENFGIGLLQFSPILLLILVYPLIYKRDLDLVKITEDGISTKNCAFSWSGNYLYGFADVVMPRIGTVKYIYFSTDRISDEYILNNLIREYNRKTTIIVPYEKVKSFLDEIEALKS